MKLEVFDDSKTVALKAAEFVAVQARSCVSARDQFNFAVSGGRTPWLMLSALAGQKIAWNKLHIFQVDERIAPDGHQDRNLTHLHESLLKNTPLTPDQIHAMQVNKPELGVKLYEQTLQQLAGLPPILDLIHLGLGADGHTASLVPGDPVLEVTDSDVALTNVYQGRKRMTLTYPILNRSRQILWLVTGSDKSGMLQRLLAGDVSIPAGRVRQEQATIFADRAAYPEHNS